MSPSSGRMTSNTGMLARWRAAVFLVLVLFSILQRCCGQAVVPYGFVDEEVVGGLSYVTDICFLPGPGRRFIALEKNGEVKLIVDEVIQSALFLDLSSSTNTYADRGMLSCLVDKNFASNPYAYFAYAVEVGGSVSGPKTGQIVRFTVNAARTGVIQSSELVLLGSVTGAGCNGLDLTSDVICCDSFTHCNGGLDMDDSGNIFIGIGDGAFPSTPDDMAMRAQVPEYLNGKILRVNRQGQGVAGNPYFTGAVTATDNAAKVWGIGVRNSWRLHVDPLLQLPWIAEVGWAKYEEFNLGTPDANFEWPCKQGPRINSAFAGFSTCTDLNAGGPINGTTAEPIYAYRRGVGVAASAAQRFDIPSWPAEYQGWIYGMDYSAGWMKRFQVDANGLRVGGPIDFATGLNGPVQTRLGLDGDSIWYVSILGQSVRKIRYAPDTTRPEIVSIRPPDGASNVEITSDIRIFFSKLVVESTLAGNVEVRPAGGGTAIAGSITFDPATFVAEFTPSSPLASFTTFEVIIADVEDPDGRLLISSTTTFTTGDGKTVFVSDLPFLVADNDHGQVERDQANGDAGPNNGEMITLNGELYAKGIGVVPPARVVVAIPTGCGRFEASVGIDDSATGFDCGRAFFKVYGDSTLLFDHPDVQTPITDTIEIDVDVTGFTELDLTTINGGCNRKNQNYASWAQARFRCGGTFDAIRPTITGFSLTDGAMDVSVDPSLVLTFSESMDQQTLIAAIRLQADGEQVGWSPSLNGPVTEVTVSTETLEYGTQYTLSVTTAARDLAGNRLQGQFSSSFTTEAAPATGSIVRVSDLTPYNVLASGAAAYDDSAAVSVGAASGQANITIFAKGLGMRANSRVDFSVPENCDQVAADYFVDAAAGVGGGTCNMNIRGDRWGKFYLQDSATSTSGLKTVTVNLRRRETLVRFQVLAMGDGRANDFCDFANARFICTTGDVFVSDLIPIQTRGSVEMDANARDGGVLSIRSGESTTVDYPHGLVVLPRIRLYYNVPGTCSWLSADVGLDPGAGSGQMDFTWYRGSGGICQRSSKLRLWDGPEPLDCNLTGETTFSLLARNGGDGRAGDIGVVGSPLIDCAAGTTRPRCDIDSLVSSFRVGDSVAFGGEGFDFQENVLGADAFEWQVILHHCNPEGCHTHLQLTLFDVKNGAYVIPNHGDYYFVEFLCTVCDNSECSTSSANVYPETAEVTVDAFPAGQDLVVGVDSKDGIAPITTTVVVGSQVSLSVLPNQMGLVFDRWSHDPSAPAATNVLISGPAPQTFNANFV